MVPFGLLRELERKYHVRILEHLIYSRFGAKELSIEKELERARVKYVQPNNYVSLCIFTILGPDEVKIKTDASFDFTVKKNGKSVMGVVGTSVFPLIYEDKTANLDGLDMAVKAVSRTILQKKLIDDSMIDSCNKLVAILSKTVNNAKSVLSSNLSTVQTASERLRENSNEALFLREAVKTASNLKPKVDMSPLEDLDITQMMIGPNSKLGTQVIINDCEYEIIIFLKGGVSISQVSGEPHALANTKKNTASGKKNMDIDTLDSISLDRLFIDNDIPGMIATVANWIEMTYSSEAKLFDSGMRDKIWRCYRQSAPFMCSSCLTPECKFRRLALTKLADTPTKGKLLSPEKRLVG